jgi:hypothetical protein
MPGDKLEERKGEEETGRGEGDKERRRREKESFRGLV